MRSFWDLEADWEPGGSSRPLGHFGTRRSIGNPDVLLDPEVVFRTRRSIGNPEVLLDLEVVFRTLRSF